MSIDRKTSVLKELRKGSVAAILGCVLMGIPAVFALTPMEYYNGLVAGGDFGGFQDGAFQKARFNRPCGLALDGTGHLLFVADKDNHRIREIHLDDDNRVETLAGSERAGQQDGSLSEASFDQPTALALLPGDRLALFDSGNHRIRLIDLKNKTVTTLVGGSPETRLGNLWNLAYSATDDSLYFSEPYDKRLRKWDFRSGKLLTVLSEDPKVPMPRAIAVSGGKLYISDIDRPDIFQLEIPTGSTMDRSALSKVGSCPPKATVHGLAGSNGTLYAALEGTQSLIRILPDDQPVSLQTAWGFYVENNDPGVEPLLWFDREGLPSGMVLSPEDPHKIFLTCPGRIQSLFYVKDHEFGQSKVDYNYPDPKPGHTFRILVVGDSRVHSAMLPLPPDKLNDPEFRVVDWDQKCSSMRTRNFPKQLEFLLNAEASLRNGRDHYEVLTLSVGGSATGSILDGPAMEIVRKKDIDLVIALAGWTTYKDYFDQPLNSEGLPGGMDLEWSLKPALDRVPPGVPRDLFDLCVKQKLVGTDKDKFYWKIDLAKWNDLGPQVRRDLMDLNGRPYRNFQKKLQTMGGAKSKRLLLLYIPWDYMPGDGYEDFWRDTCASQDLDLLDLSEPFGALKTGFYPTIQRGLTNHYLYYGDSLIAFLLTHYLTEQNRIPFGTTLNNPGSSK